MERFDQLESQDLPNHKVTIESINHDDNEVVVWIEDSKSTTHFGWRENWNLQETDEKIQKGNFKVIE